MTTAPPPSSLPAPDGIGADPRPDRARLLGERVGAVRASGWGAGFRFIQPRNLAFWVYLALVVPGMITIVRYVSSATAIYGPALTVAAVLFAIYGALFWWFTQRIDRYAHQSRRLIALAFCWGGFGAILMASNANTPILSLWGKALGTSWATDWGAGLTAPFTEEWSKGLGLLLLIALAPAAVATAFDGFILGAFIGLGFQIVEDVSYAIGAAGSDFGSNIVGAEFQTLLVRMSSGVGAHIAYTAIFCTGLVYVLGRPAQPRRRLRGFLLIITAMILHGVWDSLGGILGQATGLTIVSWLIMTAITVTIVITLFRHTVKPEREFMREVLAPEVASGTVTPEEAATLAGGSRARRAYRKVRPYRDQRRWALQAAHDLADQLARSGGMDTAWVVFARQELARIRTLIPVVPQPWMPPPGSGGPPGIAGPPPFGSRPPAPPIGSGPPAPPIGSGSSAPAPADRPPQGW